MALVLERINTDVSHFARRTPTFPSLYGPNVHAPRFPYASHHCHARNCHCNSGACPDRQRPRPKLWQQLHVDGGKDCRITNTGRDSSVSVCPGKAGLIVLVTEDDLRQTVSVGRNRKAAENEPAASTGFSPFNSTNATIEWRTVDGKPFAIIQRWMIADIDAPDKGGRPTDKACSW